MGIAVSVAGFLLIVLAWGGAAGETQVYRQMPYVVSGGLVGFGLILVGLTIVNVASQRRDEIDWRRLLQQDER